MAALTSLPTLLAGRYRPKTLLGHGESAEAYLAEDTWSPSREVVLKIQLPDTAISAKHLRREYGLLAGLKHPHLVEVFEVFTIAAADKNASARLCLVESHANGKSLTQWAGSAQPAQIATVAAQIAAALAALSAHHIRHGDIKPDNILVQDTPQGPQATLIDFGLATRLLHAGNQGGTPRFMAPEALQSQASLASDIYSLALTIAKILGETLPSALGAALASARFTNELKAMSHPNPHKRPTAAEVFELFSIHGAEQSQDALDVLQNTGVIGGPVGQAPLLEKLQVLLKKGLVHGGAFTITGHSGSGKTTLAQAASAAALLLGFEVPGGVRPASHGNLGELWRLIEQPESSHSENQSADATTIKWQRFSELALGLENLAARKPTALIFDDVPADSPIFEFATFLARRGLPKKLVWIQTTAAPTKPDKRPEDFNSPYTLANLSADDVKDLIAARRPLRPDDTKAAQEIFNATGGHPGQINHILNQFPGRELLKASSRKALTLPASQEMGERIELLTPAHQKLATFIALAPQPAPQAWWLQNMPAADADTGLAIETLLQTRIITRERLPEGPALSISGESLRGHLKELASPDDVDALIKILKAHITHYPVHAELGALLLEKGELEAAANHLVLGAQTAKENLNINLAAHLYQQALNALDPASPSRLTASVELGKIFVARGQDPEAIDAFNQAGSAPSAILELASAHLQSGRYKEVVETATPLLKENIPERDLAEVLTSRSLLMSAKLDESQELIEHALGRIGAHPLAPRLLSTRGLIAYYRGDMDTARRDIESAYQNAHGLGDPENLDLIRATLAMLLHKSGDPTGALTLYEQSLQAARQAHHLPRQVIRLTNLAVFKHETGHFEQAVELYREAAEIAYTIDGAIEQVRIGVTRGNLLFFLGEIEQAHRLISSATRLAEAQSMHTEWAYLLVLGAEVEIARGNPENANQPLELAIEKFEEAGNQAGKIEAIGAQAQLHLVQNQFEKARTLAAQTVDAALEIKRDRIAAQAGVWLALAHLPDDAPLETGIQRVSDAILLAEKLDEPDILWPLYLVACQLHARHQDLQQAAALYEQGRAAAQKAFSRISGRFETSYAQLWHRHHLWRYLQGDMDFTPGHSSKTVDRILAINRALSRDHDPERLLERIIDAAITLSGAERGFIILKDESRADGLTMRAARNMEQESPQEGESSFSRTIAIKVMEEGNLINTVNAQGDERFSEYRSVHHLNLKSVLCIPLQVPPQIVGALYLDHRHRVNAFSDVDSSLIGAFADQAAIALSNAQLVSNLRNHSEELESTRAEVEELNQRLGQELKAQAAELDAVRKNRTDVQSEEPMQHGMIGTSSPMRQVFKIINRVSDKDVPVTILGESGTGKELVARAIHEVSPRKGQFVSVNCGAISQGLWESELFGHEKGSFTGAVRAKPGLFEIANGGTLFLDEIGEMPLEVQVKLLRVLQQREFRRVGGTRTLTTDARVICATNRNLEEMVREDTFREDLWYRLNVVEIHLAPLRNRKEDVNILLDHFLVKHGGRTPPTLTRRGRAMLLDYSWPGNIRELENEVQRACALAEGDIIPDDLSGKIKKSSPKAQSPLSFGGNLKDQVAQFESSVIHESLTEADGRVAAAAEKLGLTRAGLYKKINKYKIDVNK